MSVGFNATAFLYGLISMFLLGSLPGFYLSYRYFTFTKLNRLMTVTLATITGFAFGAIGFIIIWGLEGSLHDTKVWDLFLNKLIYIVAFEILVIVIHFFYFQKREKKTRKLKIKIKS